MSIQTLLDGHHLNRSDIATLLALDDPSSLDMLRERAESMLLANCGDSVYYRGLIEFSNICAANCRYCGIRRDNHDIRRYTLTEREIIDQALWCADQGYGSLVLQAGERVDREFIDLVERCVRQIKKRSRRVALPDGLGVTLCIGEQSRETYQRLFDAGAHRYLLRIETSSPRLFNAWHPADQSLESRIACLRTLREIGYQVGTGVMIGVPGQTVDDLAADICFFRDMDVDMIGMGPYIIHPRTPFAAMSAEIDSRRQDIFSLALKMIAVTRLVLQDVNIAATTALQAIDPKGREEGLRHGANVIMPQLTPTERRKDYLLYEGKPCLDETAGQCKGCLEARIASTGRRVAYDQWGDSRHYAARRRSPAKT